MSSADNFETHEPALIAALQAGDQRGYAWVFRAKYAALVDFAQSITRQRESAESVVADVMAWLYEHRATLAPRVSLAAYLFTAVRRRALNAVRGDRRARRWHTELDEGAAAPDDQSKTDVPERLIAAEDTQALVAAVHALLARLGEPPRSIVLLRFVHDLSHEEIASVMGMTPQAVRAAFSRAIRTLRAIAGEDPREG